MKLCKSAIIFGVFVLVVLTGCATTGRSSAPPIGNASGTASATAPGFTGDITVTITMVDGYITDAQVVGNDETPSVGSVAVEKAPKLIKKNNSGEFDAISGASFTSAGISAAAQEAISKIVAGGN